MTRILAVGLFTTCLSLGAALGLGFGPLRHAVDLGALHVQSLYDAHSGTMAATDTIYAKKLVVAQNTP